MDVIFAGWVIIISASVIQGFGQSVTACTGQCLYLPRLGSKVFHVIACASHGPVRMECHGGKAISIQSASWGRAEDKHCNLRGQQVATCTPTPVTLPCLPNSQVCETPLKSSGQFVYGTPCSVETMEHTMYMDVKYYCKDKVMETPEAKPEERATSTFESPMVTDKVMETTTEPQRTSPTKAKLEEWATSTRESPPTSSAAAPSLVSALSLALLWAVV